MKKSVLSGAAIVASGLAATQAAATVKPADRPGESVVASSDARVNEAPAFRTGSDRALPKAESRQFAQTFFGGGKCGVRKPKPGTKNPTQSTVTPRAGKPKSPIKTQGRPKPRQR